MKIYLIESVGKYLLSFRGVQICFSSVEVDEHMTTLSNGKKVSAMLYREQAEEFKKLWEEL